MEEEQDRNDEDDSQVSDEEDSVRPLPDRRHRRRHKNMKAVHGQDSKDYDRGGKPLAKKAVLGEEIEVESDVAEQEAVDDAAEDLVEPIDLLVRRPENEGEGIQSFQAKKILDRKL